MYSAIFATDLVGGIGYKGSLPWPKSTEDFKWFKEKTDGQICVMGRRTWDDPKFPKPLPNRINVVITSTPLIHPKAVVISSNVEQRLAKIQTEFPDKKIFFIGGKQLLESYWHLVSQIYLTKFKQSYKVDVSVDLKSMLTGFAVKSVTPGQDCTFMEYEKNANILITS